MASGDDFRVMGCEISEDGQEATFTVQSPRDANLMLRSEFKVCVSLETVDQVMRACGHRISPEHNGWGAGLSATMTALEGSLASR